MKIEDFTDPNIFDHKKLKLKSSLDKFKKHFEKNMKDLVEKETVKNVSPKFTVCFMGLADHLKIPVTQPQKSISNE